MWSSLYFLFFVSFSLAWPFVARRGYGSSSTQLRPDLQDLWYSKYIADTTAPNESPGTFAQGTTSQKQSPTDPAATYSCIGPNVEDFPDKSEWLSFDQLWTINKPAIDQVNGGATYSDALKAAIKEVALESKVDARLILALIMQESSGKLEVHCTETTACGVMQHKGSHDFDPSNPKESIKSMIRDGIYGTTAVPGFLTYFNSDPELTWVNTALIDGNPFAAAHVYNTGHIDSPNLSEDAGKSNYYAHDILSRLQGWNGWSAGCEASKQCDGLNFQGRNCS